MYVFRLELDDDTTIYTKCINWLKDSDGKAFIVTLINNVLSTK